MDRVRDGRRLHIYIEINKNKRARTRAPKPPPLKISHQRRIRLSKWLSTSKWPKIRFCRWHQVICDFVDANLECRTPSKIVKRGSLSFALKTREQGIHPSTKTTIQRNGWTFRIEFIKRRSTILVDWKRFTLFVEVFWRHPFHRKSFVFSARILFLRRVRLALRSLPPSWKNRHRGKFGLGTRRQATFKSFASSYYYQ